MTTHPNLPEVPDGPSEVTFDARLDKKITETLKRYPNQRAALLPTLWLCQERFGWISPGVMRAVAARLGESPAYVEGVVTFYTMFRTRPPARYVLQVCRTLSCAVCGGKELLEHLTRTLGIAVGERTPDGLFELQAVECLGACGSAPVIQINDDYYENMSPEKIDAVLAELGKKE
ncbi:MAG TPA: NAD(P)H-dependent oxidoreductase subunit E [Thermoanaerobaculaceae bacterium]|nr:NAD(P)H-dependent oxidoreductase subunit E [Thermoanaerobaculaceae bacterium]HRS17070.1 NAD(P)H-dependent oxidoreductase subunit E [Thermoanaerobaculaceae bacterium]